MSEYKLIQYFKRNNILIEPQSFVIGQRVDSANCKVLGASTPSHVLVTG